MIWHETIDINFIFIKTNKLSDMSLSVKFSVRQVYLISNHLSNRESRRQWHTILSYVIFYIPISSTTCSVEKVHILLCLNGFFEIPLKVGVGCLPGQTSLGYGRHTWITKNTCWPQNTSDFNNITDLTWFHWI